MYSFDDEFAPAPPSGGTGGARQPVITRPQWVDDESVTACFNCNDEFNFFNRRHHCRACGQVFCNDCSGYRKLMPREFGVAEPQRCCAKCAVILEPLQPELQATIAPAMQANQLKEGEVTGEYRRYTNSPFKFDLASEVRKATYTLQNQLEGLETKIEDHHVKESFLRDAHGLAFITTMQGGCIASVQTGTGLVITRQGQNTWSAPCAVGTIGVGFGALFGLESTDLMIVLPDEASVNTFISSGQFAIGGEVNLALGPFGRAIKADVRANHKSAAPTISYSNSRGFYGGISLEGSFLKVRHDVNRDFYGRDASPEEILRGHIEAPPAAQPMYDALARVYTSFDAAPIPGGAAVSDFQSRQAPNAAMAQNYASYNFASSPPQQNNTPVPRSSSAGFPSEVAI